ncbi:MAG: hypothetical protein RI957_193 [Verrucomicrobiota bacterium]
MRAMSGLGGLGIGTHPASIAAVGGLIGSGGAAGRLMIILMRVRFSCGDFRRHFCGMFIAEVTVDLRAEDSSVLMTHP